MENVDSIEKMKGVLLADFNTACGFMDENSSPEAAQAVTKIAQTLLPIVGDEKTLKQIETGLYLTFNKANEVKEAFDGEDKLLVMDVLAGVGDILTKVSRKIDLLQPSIDGG
jgi:hypothetical protein